jgi:predicted transcriptional regulator
MNQKRNQTTLRLNDDLDKKLSDLAKKMGVSKNAYILMVLNRAV